MFKNEGRYLKEWIEYHRLLGVEHFYLYNNDSADNYREVLSPYLEEGLVDLIDWNSDSAPHHNPFGSPYWVGFQHSAFNDSLARAKECAKWMAIIDVDEFLFPSAGLIDGVADFHFLLNHADSDVGTFSLWWRNFGTSGIWELPMESLITESILHRAKNESIYNLHHKCIHRIEAVSYTLVHEAHLKEGYKSIEIDAERLRVNHYYLGDRKRCIQKRSGPSGLAAMEAHFNEVYDNSIMPFADLVRDVCFPHN